MTIRTRKPGKYLLTDTESGAVWRNTGRGWKRDDDAAPARKGSSPTAGEPS